jgi:hypothetical protein
VALNQKFTDAFAELTAKISELKIKRSDKVLPAFNKTMQIYDLLQKYIKNIPDFITPALTIEKDQHTINIYTKVLGSQEKEPYDNIKVEPARGFKIDFAPGIFVSGLYDAKYTIKSKDSIWTTQYIAKDTVRDTTINKTFTSVYQQDQCRISIGAMIMLHAHSQWEGIFNLGGYIGFGALFNDQTRWTMSTGLSFLLGRKSRFNISLGAATAQVDRLQQPYQTEQWYAETIDNVPTVKVWKINYMIGFSWNL